MLPGHTAPLAEPLPHKARLSWDTQTLLHPTLPPAVQNCPSGAGGRVPAMPWLSSVPVMSWLLNSEALKRCGVFIYFKVAEL